MKRSAVAEITKLNRVGIPQDIATEFGVTEETKLEVEGAQKQYILARCMTEMREAMNKAIDARLIMGGKTSDYSGKYPGLFEEAYMALRDGKSLFLLGAFGGCARAVIELLQGVSRSSDPQRADAKSKIRKPR